jgi:hypothetical protein
MAAPVMGWIANLKPPNVVSQFRAANQFGVRQIAEVSKNSRLVESDRYKFVRDFGVRLRLASFSQCHKHRDTSRRAPQACGSQDFAYLFYFIRFLLVIHDFSLPLEVVI